VKEALVMAVLPFSFLHGKERGIYNTALMSTPAQGTSPVEKSFSLYTKF